MRGHRLRMHACHVERTLRKVEVMLHTRRHRAPKLEPEVLDRLLPASLGGARLSPERSGHVGGASAPESAGGGTHDAAVTIALCDGSRVTFARYVDLSTAVDA